MKNMCSLLHKTGKKSKIWQTEFDISLQGVSKDKMAEELLARSRKKFSDFFRTSMNNIVKQFIGNSGILALSQFDATLEMFFF